MDQCLAVEGGKRYEQAVAAEHGEHAALRPGRLRRLRGHDSQCQADQAQRHGDAAVRARIMRSAGRRS